LLLFGARQMVPALVATGVLLARARSPISSTAASCRSRETSPEISIARGVDDGNARRAGRRTAPRRFSRLHECAAVALHPARPQVDPPTMKSAMKDRNSDCGCRQWIAAARNASTSITFCMAYAKDAGPFDRMFGALIRKLVHEPAFAQLFARESATGAAIRV
jgi:hypothetical protein